MGAEGDGADSRAASGCGLQGEGSPMSPDEWKRLGVGRSAQVWRGLHLDAYCDGGAFLESGKQIIQCLDVWGRFSIDLVRMVPQCS